MRIVFAIALAIIFTWFYLRSKGSLLIAILLHTSINVLSDLGLSSYGTAAMVFGLFTGVASVLLSVFSTMLRPGKADG